MPASHHLFDTSLTSLAPMRKWAGGLLGITRPEHQRYALLILALDEICTNIIRHAAGSMHREDNHFAVRLAQETDYVDASILYDGSYFDLTKYEPLDIDTLILQRKAGGMGVRLVKNVADSISYQHTEGHNEYTIRVYLNADHPKAKAKPPTLARAR